MANNTDHLRTQMKIIQGSFSSRDRRSVTNAIADVGQDFLASGGRKVIAGFFPVGDQITPLLLMQALFHRQLPLALPKLDDQNSLRFYSWWPGAKMHTPQGAIPAPLECEEEVAPDYLLVPMLGFDQMGNRLGFGSDFYSQAIRSVRARSDTTVVGIGFAEQELGAILHDDSEGRLDWIITQNGLRGLTQ